MSWVGDRIDDAKGLAGDAAGWMYPGDGVTGKVRAFADGTSPLSPMHSFHELKESVGEAAPAAIDAAGDHYVPGYSEAGDAYNAVNGFVGDTVPGGWGGVGLLLLLLVLWALLKSAPKGVRVTKNVAKGAAATYAPGATALVKGRPLPKPKGAHASSSRGGPRGRCGRTGKPEMVVATARVLEVCASDEKAGMAAARKRWTGWDIKRTATDPCDRNPDKVHVRVTKRKGSR